MNPIGWLRLEAAVELAAASWLYSRTGVSWYWFIGLFLAPDIGMIGYLAGPRIGAWCYNAMHTYSIVIPMVIAAWMSSHPFLYAVSLIWCAHISFDRMVGYGLKRPESFQSTYLGSLGKKLRDNSKTEK